VRTYHWLTSILFGAVILVTAVAAVVRAVPYDVPSGTPVLDGGLTRSFESHYDEVFPVKTFGTNLWGAIQYVLFREGRSGVVVGANGWLYTSEEFSAYPDGDAQVDAHLDLIRQVRDRLRQRGTELTVAVLPAKARLYPEYVAPHQPAEVHRELYRRIHAGLAERGVSAPDLLAPMAQCKERTAVFLRTDTHWTPEGASCGAQALAAAIAPRAGDAPRYVSEAGAAEEHQGDLMKFLPLSPYFSRLMPSADRLVVRTTVATSSGSAEADLLGDAPAPTVVLVGTSYSADRRWNFDGALRESLGEEVLNLAQPGHGPFEPMLAYLEQPLDGPAPARLIWEIPERYLPAATKQVPASKPRNDHHHSHGAQVASAGEGS
jgi:alginate O-acetyltransferase complex protein AlgJ